LREGKGERGWRVKALREGGDIEREKRRERGEMEGIERDRERERGSVKSLCVEEMEDSIQSGRAARHAAP
jgi:hypothetical protein